MLIARYIFVFIVTAAALAASVSAQPRPSDPKSAVRAFMRFDGSNSQVFDRKAIDARRRWFSEELYGLFLKELEREKEFLKANPTDKPHFGDGLPFRPLDEVCELKGRKYRRTITYGQETVKGDLANVDVRFSYPKGCNIPDILYAFNMSRENGRWVIDDVRYFPENTSLVEDLKRAEY